METEDNFMKIFKQFKSNKQKPSLDQVLSVEDNRHSDKVIQYSHSVEEDERAELLGLQSINKWQMYMFTDHPGLYLIRNPFTSLGQRYWIRRCLEDYPKKPNKTNIDIEVVLEDWWQTCYESGECNQQMLKKLRWSTLGYHHNWDTKEYSEDNRAPFPDDLAELSDVIAQYIKYPNFKAEAAIVNYYHMKSTLSAHTDHSEVNLEAPLFSFSFGQSAIFLIGGQEKSSTPSAVLLQSGDIMVMSKEARLCYHAVPKILPAPTSPWNDQNNDFKFDHDNIKVPYLKYIKNPDQMILCLNRNVDEEEWSRFSNYVKESRINMNVRQVLNERQTSL